MPLINLEGEREATTQDSEEYGKKVIELLNLRGYILEHDSNFEGTFEDKVFRNPKLDGNISTVIEIKDTSLGLNDKKFIVELGKYLLSYQKSQFNLIIYVRNLSNLDKWKKVFDSVKQEEKEVNNLFEKIKAQDKTFSKLKFENFKELINKTKVYQVSYPKLIQKIEELKQDNIFKTEQDYLIEDENLEYQKEELQGNFYFVKNYPKWIYGYKFKENISIKDFWKYSQADIFSEREGYLYCLREFSDEIINSYCDKSTYKKIEWSEIELWKDYEIFLRKIIKTQIILKAYDEGFYYDRRKKILYKPHKNLKEEKFKIKLQSEKTRYLTRVFRNSDSTINFVLHRGIKFNVMGINGEYFVVFNNFRVFSEDGKKIMIGDHAKRLNAKFMPIRAYNNMEKSKLHFLVKAIGLVKYNLLQRNQFFFDNCFKLDIECKTKNGEIFQENFDYEDNIYPTLKEFFEE
nr:hypothetical protein [Nanoarchaeum sp.]